uniref:Ribosome receptor lysine/proline rich domain-containing protein n=1 Tax=Timema poppense TaxID=170557 RepID=A0A7R9CI39_TIMPO|nr:unnamed protein product [Timema poppensis]
MDIQTGVICVGVAGMSAIAIFVIFVMFGMKEKTYDEAIAEQRKMPEEHLLLGRSTKDKAKDKKQKKAGKKVKEKPRDEREKNIHADSKTTTTHEKTHVEFEEPEAEFINDRPPQPSSPSLTMPANRSSQSLITSALTCTTSSPHPVILPPLSHTTSCIHPEQEVVWLDHDRANPIQVQSILLPSTLLTSRSLNLDSLDLVP